LSSGLKDLRLLWEQTKLVWNDPVREAFEEQQWNVLEQRVMGALRAVERIGPIIDRLQHECGQTS
jgi:hypothetical protein